MEEGVTSMDLRGSGNAFYSCIELPTVDRIENVLNGMHEKFRQIEIQSFIKTDNGFALILKGWT